jgi:hypothetical protein
MIGNEIAEGEKRKEPLNNHDPNSDDLSGVRRFLCV